MMKRAFFCCAIGFCATTSVAQSLSDVVSHRIVPGWQQADGSLMAGLQIDLAPGWKTYWRAPGDAGIPPQFDWSGARNLAQVDVHYPAPDVFWQSGMRSVGYKNGVVFPLTIVPKSDGRDVRLKGRVSIGVCSDICMPYEIEFNEVLDIAGHGRAPAIVAALANMPYSADEAGLHRATCRFSQSEYGMMVEAQLDLPTTGGREEAVIEPPQAGIWVSDATASRKGGRLTVNAEMASHSGEPFAIDRSRVRITVLGGNYAVDIQGCDAG